MTDKKPDVVQADPLPSWAKLSVSDSFYEDVKREQNFNPEGIKARDELFEKSLREPIEQLAQATESILKTPSVTSRGPRPKPQVTE